MKLVKFQRSADRKPVYVNPEQVVGLETAEVRENGTIIQLTGPVFHAVVGAIDAVASKLQEN